MLYSVRCTDPKDPSGLDHATYLFQVFDTREQAREYILGIIDRDDEIVVQDDYSHVQTVTRDGENVWVYTLEPLGGDTLLALLYTSFHPLYSNACVRGRFVASMFTTDRYSMEKAYTYYHDYAVWIWNRLHEEDDTDLLDPDMTFEDLMKRLGLSD